MTREAGGLFENLDEVSVDMWKDDVHVKRQLALDLVAAPKGSPWALFTGSFRDQHKVGWTKPRGILMRYRRFSGWWQQHQRFNIALEATEPLLEVVQRWHENPERKDLAGGKVSDKHSGVFLDPNVITRTIRYGRKVGQIMLDREVLVAQSGWMTMAFLIRRAQGPRWSAPYLELRRYRKRSGAWYSKGGIAIRCGEGADHALECAKNLVRYREIPMVHPVVSRSRVAESLVQGGHFDVPAGTATPLVLDGGSVSLDPEFKALHQLEESMGYAVEGWEGHRCHRKTKLRELMPEAGSVLVDLRARDPQSFIRAACLRWEARILEVEDTSGGLSATELGRARLRAPAAHLLYVSLARRQAKLTQLRQGPNAKTPKSPSRRPRRQRAAS